MHGFFLLFLVLFTLGGAVSERQWSRREMVAMAGYGEEKLSSVVVTGTLLCSDHPLSFPIPVPGATVAIKCQTGVKRRSRWIKTVTDELGEFVMDLPSHLHGIPDMGKTCLVKPVHVPKPYKCHPSASKKHRGLKLVSSSNGFRMYTTGKIRLQKD
ncbi:PREDICTED: uncharacterized protein LOC104806736 [Tarenaya hassleriana]|uniref:uncharacterized protein LOC104806736 n=1 Tax=Tarenaya hassleriana TaxID=28532 RepID=UPI00053C3EF7|nr:PREDICTED: uncharacterized protein LOC104806736 [Tarenaya hassleriana]